MRSPITAICAILAAAIVGWALVTLVPQVFLNYKEIAASNPAMGVVYLAAAGVGTAIIVGAVVWFGAQLWGATRAKRARRKLDDAAAGELSDRQKQDAIAAKLGETKKLTAAADIPAQEKVRLECEVKQLEKKLAEESLEIAAFGTISSGKSSLLNTLAGADVFAADAPGGTTARRGEVPWPSDNKVILVDTPGLAEVAGLDHEQMAREVARSADLVLFVVDGPLRAFEHRVLSQLVQVEKPILVCLNKGDLFSDDDRKTLLGQVREQVKEYAASENVVAVQTRAAVRNRVRVLADGAEQEETVELSPNITPLVKRMQAALHGRKSLLLANVLLRARGIYADAREQLQAHLDAQAWKIVDRYMWQSGAIVALIPFPVVDVITGLGFTTKMVVELSHVYQQRMDLGTAQRLLGELGKNLLAIVGANFAALPAGTIVAQMLKAVPGIGTVAGGTLQGVIQALITRWIGSIFIDYYRAEMREPPGGLAELARQKWKEVTQVAALADLVRQSRARRKEKKTEHS